MAIPLFLQFFADIHLNHVVLLPQLLVLFRIVKTGLEILWQRLIVLSFIFKLALLELCGFG